MVISWDVLPMLGVTTLPSNVVYQGLVLALFCLFLLVKVCHSLSGVELPHTSPCSIWYCLGTICILVEELQLGQMYFGPLPSLPRNPPLELHQEISPGH